MFFLMNFFMNFPGIVQSHAIWCQLCTTTPSKHIRRTLSSTYFKSSKIILQTSVNASLSKFIRSDFCFETMCTKFMVWWLAFISVPRRSEKAHKIVVATRKITQCKVEFIKILESNNYYQKHTYWSTDNNIVFLQN